MPFQKMRSMTDKCAHDFNEFSAVPDQIRSEVSLDWDFEIAF